MCGGGGGDNGIHCSHDGFCGDVDTCSQTAGVRQVGDNMVMQSSRTLLSSLIYYKDASGFRECNVLKPVEQLLQKVALH